MKFFKLFNLISVCILLNCIHIQQSFALADDDKHIIDSTESSRTDLEYSLWKARTEYQEIDQQIKELEGYVQLVGNGIQGLQTEKNYENLDIYKKHLVEIFKKLNLIYEGGSSDFSLNEIIQEINQIVEKISKILYGNFNIKINELIEVQEKFHEKSMKIINKAKRNIVQSGEQEWLKQFQNIYSIRNDLNQLQHPITIKNFRDIIQVDAIKKSLEEISRIDSKILLEYANSINLSRATSLNKYIDEIKNQIDNLTNLKKSASIKYKNANSQLFSKEKGIQEYVSNQLLWFFGGSLALVFLTLMILAFAPHEKTNLLVKERTAFETISICLFLTTVLFLGTGGFIEKATLGTLLGTLAGYLFTRRMNTPRSNDRDRE